MGLFEAEAAADKAVNSTYDVQKGTAGCNNKAAQPSMQQQQQQHLAPGLQHPALKALLARKLGVAFSGAGFGAAYQLGAADILSRLGVLHAATPLSALKQASTDLIQHGRDKRMRSTLEPLIRQLLPENAHELCTGAGAPPFKLAATKVLGPCPVCWRPDLAGSGFSSKQELIDRLLAGAHEPRVSDAHCFARERGHGWFVDGGIKMPVAPIPDVDYTVIVYPVANQLLRRPWPYKLLMHAPPPEAIAISPGQYLPWPLTKSYKESNKLVMHPQPPEMLDTLFERGRRDALAWAQYVDLDEVIAARTAAAAPTGLQNAPITAAAVPVQPPQASAVATPHQTVLGRGPGGLLQAHLLASSGMQQSEHSSIFSSALPAALTDRSAGRKSFAGTAGGSSHGAVSSGASAMPSQGAASDFTSMAGTSVAGSEYVPASTFEGAADCWGPRVMLGDVHLSRDEGLASMLAQQRQLLATPVSELPMVVPVPSHLLHMLS